MDIIVERYFEKFSREHHIVGNDRSKKFEKFINHCVLSTQNISNLELSTVDTGEGDDCSTDGIAISVNNRFVSNLTELTDIINFNMEVEVKFFFIQTKMSSNFDGSEILNFGNGIIDIFRPEGQNRLRRNEKIKEKCKMIELILDNFEILKDQTRSYLYYVTTGKWEDDQNLNGVVQKIVSDLKALDLFKEVDFNPVGKNEIRQLYESSKQQNSAEFTLQNKLEIPYIEGINEGYLALMPVKDLVKLISEGDILKKGIFDSNVRDFQGLTDNRVNQDINSTINSVDNNRFGLLNNGVTIVGKSLNKGQGKYTIKNFQVVNGCQTSNILFENRDKLNDEMWVSVKIVITEVDEIINNIVKATNNQTEVEEIQLQAMTEYQHLLESFYNTYSFNGETLFYERRLGQYNSRVDIEHNRVVSFEEQIKSFAAVFLNIPHRASRFYKTILEEVEKKIFVKGHEPIAYFTSAYLNYRLEDMFNNDRIEHKFKKYKYHIMMLMRMAIYDTRKMPPLNSNKIMQYCEHILNAVITNFNIVLEEALNVVETVIKDLDNLENNKYNHIVNHLIMFNDLKLTEQDLQVFKKFIHEIDAYIIPFHNIKIDGDMRYNIVKWINDLIWVLNDNKFFDTVDEINRYTSNLNEDSRDSRREVSELIYKRVLELKNHCIKQVDLSKKYTMND
ncbi:AIPR family protein [Bacillus vallismortis]|uniref:AIPR family protein n=1 Tax=Bacillus vallismortis TaxID=72361 RepID=UPI0022829122|nr:AIPR family protein [Bacillus vallismortis]MCY8307737.1 AIPR family protein [Bacillus vallismortis]MCY8597476.1 AIPR family protein [Bacillus vallismortis]